MGQREKKENREKLTTSWILKKSLFLVLQRWFVQIKYFCYVRFRIFSDSLETSHKAI
jgi:hypothetical protein